MNPVRDSWRWIQVEVRGEQTDLQIIPFQLPLCPNVASSLAIASSSESSQSSGARRS